MTEVLEYIVSNYTWIIIGIIIILLAIIGSYADKTNFGQGKSKDKKEDLDSDPISVNDFEYQTLDNNMQEDNNNKEERSDDALEHNDAQTSKTINNIDEKSNDENVSNEDHEETQSNTDQVGQNETKETFEEKFDKFDKEFNSVLPEKNVINGDLLEDIDSLSLEKADFTSSEIPDLDDIELPKIKQIEKEEDIWKF